MAVYYVTANGTKTSGDSTEGDWDTPSNCYNSDNIKGAFHDADSLDDIILDDVVHVIAAKQAFNQQAGAMDITFSSRSGDPDTCKLSSSIAADVMFNINPFNAPEVYDFTFENIGFTHTGAFTFTDGMFMTLSRYAGDLTFNNCRFSDIAFTQTTANQLPWLMNVTPHQVGTTARALTFTDCQFNNNITSTGGRKMVGTYDSTTNATVTLTFNDCSADGNQVTYTAEESAAARQGIIGIGEATSVLVIRGLDITNTSLTSSGSDVLFGAIVLETLTSADIDDLHVRGMVKDHGGNANRGCGVTCNYTTGVTTLSNSSASYCTNDVSGTNTIGCLIVCLSPTTATVVTNCEAHHNRGFYGCCVYAGFNASITAIGCRGYYNDGGAAGLGDAGADIEGVDFYTGGTGDSTWIGCSSWGSVVQPGANSISAEVLFHNDAARTDRAKTVNIINCSFSAPSGADDVMDIWATGEQGAGQAHIANLDNTIVTGGDGTIRTRANATQTLTVNTTNCIYGTIAAAANVTLNETGKVGTAPGFISSTNLELAETSDAVGAGTAITTPNLYVGANGEPFPNVNIDVGAYPSTYPSAHPFHPVNL